jgi:hypothetical protein
MVKPEPSSLTVVDWEGSTMCGELAYTQIQAEVTTSSSKASKAMLKYEGTTDGC